MPIINLQKFIATSLLLLITACSSTRAPMQINEAESGHFQLYSYPEKLPSPMIDEDKEQKVIFATINDFQGEFSSQIDNGITVGGTSLLKRYLQILKAKFPDKVLTLDAGNFTSVQSSPVDIINFYNEIGLDVAGLGLNEFNLDYRRLKYPYILTKNLRKARFKTLNANLYDLKLSKRVNWKNVDHTYIYNFHGIKIGFTSVITQDVAHGFSQKMNGFYAKDIAQTIVSEATWLKKKGADLIIVLANAKGNCSINTNLPPGKFNFDSSSQRHCDLDSEIFKAYKLIPKNLVDLVFLSGTNSKIVNTINKIPTIQSPSGKTFLSLSEITLDKETKKIKEVLLHQPVKLCESFLAKSQDCYYEKGDRLELIPARFLETQIIHNIELH